MRLKLAAAAAALSIATPGSAATIILDFEEPALAGLTGSIKGFVSQGIQFRQDYVILTPAPDREAGGIARIAPLGGGYFTPGAVDLRLDVLEGSQPTELTVRYRTNDPTGNYHTTTFDIDQSAFASGQTFDLSSIGEVRFMELGFGIATKFGLRGRTISYMDNLVLNGVTFDPAAAIPEPATWMMLVFGFAFVGGVIRRENRRLASLA